MTHTKHQLTIDIVSDVVCPWCAIGYRQLEIAAGLMADRAEFNVRWHPFELVPGMAKEGQNLTDYMRERYGATPEQGRGNRDRLVEAGKALGLEFNYSPESRIYNSHRAHQLLAWAGEVGGQTALKMQLFHAYFTDQANIAETDVLLAAVERAGLDGVAARAVLEDGRYAEQVGAEIEHWQDQNITGVPAFIVNGKVMIPGAQEAETFVQILDRVIEREVGTNAH
jgi:predicted DsbA family dithiol-disulfide isomerase